MDSQGSRNFFIFLPSAADVPDSCTTHFRLSTPPAPDRKG